MSSRPLGSFQRIGENLPIDDETLRLLLAGGHLSIPDREARGIWPHPPLKFDDLVAFLVPIVEEQGYFPRAWEEHVEGEVVSEDIVIQKEGEGTYIVKSRRHHPIIPTVLAEESATQFDNPQEACAYYLRWRLMLPGDLDGWIVQK
jgi:hypothetical protein